MKDEIVMISVDIISNAGNAKSCFVEAVEMAKNNKIRDARERITEGEKSLVESHKAHAKLLTMEANEKSLDFSLLLMHAEDQMMSIETLQIMAESFVELYEKING